NTDDVFATSKFQRGLGKHIRSRAPRNIVHNYGSRSIFLELAVMSYNTGLCRLVVIRTNGENSIYTIPLHPLHFSQQLSGIVATQSVNNGNPPGIDVDDKFEHSRFLFGR